MLCGLVGIGLLLPIGTFLLAPVPRPSSDKFDLIMVFPDTPERIAAGFKLAQDGYAPLFAISNAGLKSLEADARNYGRPTAVEFVTSPKSRSTFEDAFNTREIVRQHGVRSLQLVTSAWHMPRSYFLLKCLLSGTGVVVRTAPVEDPRTAPGGRQASILRAKLAVNETVKCWGSTLEMTWSLLTGRLLLDFPSCHKCSEFIKKKILFTDSKPSVALEVWKSDKNKVEMP